MSLFSSRIVKVLSLGAVLVSSAYAAIPRISVRPKARIVEKVDTTKLTSVAGSHPKSISSMTDLGRVNASTPMQTMNLVLRSSDEQENELARLLDEQQKAGHQNFHQWLTPETFGASFGVDPSDVAQITGWLKSAGLTVNKVTPSQRLIQFTGTAGAVEKAFNTEIHSYSKNGQTVISNASDISIPQALSPVVRGIARVNTLHSLQPQAPQVGVREIDGTMHVAAAGSVGVGGTVNPLFTNPPAAPLGGGTAGAHYIGGADFSMLYDTTPLLNKGINGSGVSIGLVESSDINSSDVAMYRSVFGLPVNSMKVIHVGIDTGIMTYDDLAPGNADVIGATDAEVSGAVAPMATIYYVVSGNTLLDDANVDDSAVYLVENNTTDIIVMNTVVDETDAADVGDIASCNAQACYEYNGDTQFFQTLWEQAAAQGQSVFVTAGNGGPSSYDIYQGGYNYSAPTDTGVYSVNAYAATPFNVAVGSTEFNEGTVSYNLPGATTYWAAAATAPPYQTALGYIPENAWDQSASGTINGAPYPGGTSIYSGGGGVSAYSPLPSWQSYPANAALNIPGISLTTDPAVQIGTDAYPAGYLATTPGPHRLLPDVSMASGTSHDGAIICYEGNCTESASGQLSTFGIMAGTTTSTASMAGIQALINQQQAQAAKAALALNPSSTTIDTTGRQGNPNYYYYAIAKMQESAAAICNASTYPVTNTANTSVCGFHDVTVGNTLIPGKAPRGGTATSLGWNATPGYDLATGLGSPDAANLAAQWSAAAAKFQPTTVGFNIYDYNNAAVQYPVLIGHADDVQMGVNVYPVDNTGFPITNPAVQPTGDVGIIAVPTNSSGTPIIQGGVGFYNITNGGCQNYAGASVPITAASSILAGSASTGYLETVTFTGNVALGYVDEIAANGYVLLAGLSGPFAFLNNTYQIVSAANGTTFSIQVASPAPVAPSTVSIPVIPVNAPITNFAVTSNVVTLTAANTFTAGMYVTFSGLKVATFLNGLTIPVLASGLSATGFQVAFTTATVASTADTGTAAASPLQPAVAGVTALAYAVQQNYGAPLPLPVACGGYAGDQNVYDTLNNGDYTYGGNFPGLPGGTYNVYAHYTGDTIYAGSNSQMVPVVVSPEISGLEVDAYSVTTSDSSELGPGIVTLPYGVNLYLDAYVTNDSGYGTPTGTVTIKIAGAPANFPQTLTLPLDASDDTELLAGPGVETFGLEYLTAPNYPVLPAGIYTISGVYSGDPSFVGANSNPFSITVTPVAPKITLTLEAGNIASTGSATILASIANAAPAVYPSGQSGSAATGTLTFVDTSVTPNVTVGTCTVVATNGAGVCTVQTTPSTMTTAGAHVINVNFADTDGNYTSVALGASKTVSVTVDATTATASSVVLSGLTQPTGSQVGAATAQITATVTPTTAAGTVALYANGAEITTGTLAAGTVKLTIPATVTAGTYNLTATFDGSTTVAASPMSAPVSFVQGQNTPLVTVYAPPTGDIGSGYSIQSVVTMSPNNQGKAALQQPVPNLLVNFTEVVGTKTISLGSTTAVDDPTGFKLIADLTTLAVIPGPGVITATYMGDANYAPAVATEAVNIGLTNVTSITANSPTGTVGTGSVTFTAVVTPQVNTTTAFCVPTSTSPLTYPTTCGTVSFYDTPAGGVPTLIGKATALPPGAALANAFTQVGVATLIAALPTTSTSHTITATYSGDTHFFTSTATGPTLTSVQPTNASFTIAANPTSLTVAQGSSGSISITATVVGNWAGTAPLVCTGLPANSYCTFSYNPNTPPTAGSPLSYFVLPGVNGSNYTGILTVTTLQPHAVKGVGASGLLWLPALALAGCLGLRRKQLSLRGRQLMVLAILLCGSLATTACSTLGMATPPGSSTVTVTANGAGTTAASPAVVTSTTFTLTVTQ